MSLSVSHEAKAAGPHTCSLEEPVGEVTEGSRRRGRDANCPRGELMLLFKLSATSGTPRQRLLEVERLSHDPSLGEAAFQQINQPRKVDGQRVPALRSTDPRVLTLWSALVMFRLLPSGFASRDFRQQLASLSGPPPQSLTPGRISYDLRRLRLHGMIEPIPGRTAVR
jgi:hypothetical protein